MARGKVIRNPVTAKHDHFGSRGWYLAGKNQFVVNFGGVNLIQYLRREGDIYNTGYHWIHPYHAIGSNYCLIKHALTVDKPCPSARP